MKNLYLKNIIRITEIFFSFGVAFFAVFFLFALIPLKDNYRLLVVQSGSMEPTIPVGSVVLVAPQSAYSVGDVVTFAPSLKDKKKLVTHRIAGFSSDSYGMLYETKGDANKTVDTNSLPAEQIVGQVLVAIPFVGYIFDKLQSPLGFIIAVIVPATIVIYEELKKVRQTFGSEVKKYVQKKKPHESPSQDDQLVSQIQSLRQTESVVYAPKVLMAFVMFGISFAFVGMTRSYFSDVEIGGAALAASDSFPLSSSSPSPEHIVINELFYDVDGSHGVDSPGDRGVTVGNHVTKIRIEKNGALSDNSPFVDIETLCQSVQKNQTQVVVDVNQHGTSGDNSQKTGSIESGDVSNTVVVDAYGGHNTLGNFCGKGLGRNDEWIEIYNPTSEIVNLKNWSLTDNSGIEVKISGTHLLEPETYVLLSKSSSTWRHWSEPEVLKISLGRQIGDGLDDAGDHVILKDPNGLVIDALSYGDDTTQFNLPGVEEGHSLERDPDGFDTNTFSEWKDRFLPSPGT